MCPFAPVAQRIITSPAGQRIINAAGAITTTVIVASSGIITKLAESAAKNDTTCPECGWEKHPFVERIDPNFYSINSNNQQQQGQGQQKGQTEEKKKNLAEAEKKGIPKDQLGPSGKPKVHVVKHPTEKRAKDAARNAGQRKPAKDVKPKKGGDHYHPTNKDGSRKKGKQNIHHEFPSD